MRYTSEQREAALSVSLCFLAERLGFTVTGRGRTRGLKEISSMRIYNDRSWYRFSGKSRGGTQIDFMMEFGGCAGVPEAIARILHMAGLPALIPGRQTLKAPDNSCKADNKKPEDERPAFRLPPPAENYKRAFSYLHDQRGISYRIIQFMADKKILYEEARYHNLVFVGRNLKGEARYAALRGTYTYGGQFRGEVSGSDKRYGVRLANPESRKLFVFEAVIDMMSYMDLKQDFISNMLALGCTSDRALLQFLKDYPHVKKIVFCLDNDEAGRKAVFGMREKVNSDTGEILKEKETGLLEKYSEKGYKTGTEFPAGEGKDWNDELRNCIKGRLCDARK